MGYIGSRRPAGQGKRRRPEHGQGVGQQMPGGAVGGRGREEGAGIGEGGACAREAVRAR